MCENCGKLAKHKNSECPKLLGEDVEEIPETAAALNNRMVSVEKDIATLRQNTAETTTRIEQTQARQAVVQL